MTKKEFYLKYQCSQCRLRCCKFYRIESYNFCFTITAIVREDGKYHYTGDLLCWDLSGREVHRCSYSFYDFSFLDEVLYRCFSYYDCRVLNFYGI